LTALHEAEDEREIVGGGARSDSATHCVANEKGGM